VGGDIREILDGGEGRSNCGLKERPIPNTKAWNPPERDIERKSAEGGVSSPRAGSTFGKGIAQKEAILKNSEGEVWLGLDQKLLFLGIFVKGCREKKTTTRGKRREKEKT